jgi:hypothetical protein
VCRVIGAISVRALRVSFNVIGACANSVHGALQDQSQIFADLLLWTIHSVEYIRRVLIEQESSARREEAVIDDRQLIEIEKDFAAGLTSADILDLFARHGVAFSEATLRKYVQLGLLPRSVRVGKKGKHQGSQGIYPVNVVRQILAIKQMMAENYTIEQIQREFLFIRSDVEELEQTLSRIFKSLDGVLRERRSEGGAKSVQRDVVGARSISKDLLARLVAIETKLTSRTRMEHVAAS